MVFVDDNSGKAKRVIVEVKNGHVKSGDIRDFGYAVRCAEKLCFSVLYDNLRGYAAASDGRQSRKDQIEHTGEAELHRTSNGGAVKSLELHRTSTGEARRNSKASPHIERQSRKEMRSFPAKDQGALGFDLIFSESAEQTAITLATGEAERNL